MKSPPSRSSKNFDSPWFGAGLLMIVGLTFLSFACSLLSTTAAESASNPATAASDPEEAEKKEGDAPKELFSGKVVLLQEALKRRGVKSAEEFKSQVVLETNDGELIPIVPDWRGRALYQDKRLRDRKIELIGSREKADPYLQVQMIFVFDKQGARQYMDYWCDICSIAMYEIKPCDCCQEEIRLRLEPQELPSFIKRPRK